MVRVRLVCGLKAAVLLAAFILLGTYARLSAFSENDNKKLSHVYTSSPLRRDAAGELQNTRQSSSMQSEMIATPAVHQRRRPPLAYSVKDMPLDERIKVRMHHIALACIPDTVVYTHAYSFKREKSTRSVPSTTTPSPPTRGP